MLSKMKLRKDKPPSWWTRTSKLEKIVVAVFLFAMSYAIYRAIIG